MGRAGSLPLLVLRGRPRLAIVRAALAGGPPALRRAWTFGRFALGLRRRQRRSLRRRRRGDDRALPEAGPRPHPPGRAALRAAAPAARGGLRAAARAQGGRAGSGAPGRRRRALRLLGDPTRLVRHPGRAGGQQGQRCRDPRLRSLARRGATRACAWLWCARGRTRRRRSASPTASASPTPSRGWTRCPARSWAGSTAAPTSVSGSSARRSSPTRCSSRSRRGRPASRTSVPAPRRAGVRGRPRPGARRATPEGLAREMARLLGDEGARAPQPSARGPGCAQLLGGALRGGLPGMFPSPPETGFVEGLQAPKPPRSPFARGGAGMSRRTAISGARDRLSPFAKRGTRGFDIAFGRPGRADRSFPPCQGGWEGQPPSGDADRDRTAAFPLCERGTRGY